jgi:IS1 transposase
LSRQGAALNLINVLLAGILPRYILCFIQSTNLLQLQFSALHNGAMKAVAHFKQGILGWVLGGHSAQMFKPLWTIVATWQCYIYVTDGWSVYPGFIPEGDQIVSKTYMTRVEGENTRLRHYLA